MPIIAFTMLSRATICFPISKKASTSAHSWRLYVAVYGPHQLAAGREANLAAAGASFADWQKSVVGQI